MPLTTARRAMTGGFEPAPSAVCTTTVRVRAACNFVEIARGHAARLRSDAEAKGCWERSIDNEDG